MGPWDLFLPPLFNTPFALFDLWLINQAPRRPHQLKEWHFEPKQHKQMRVA